MKFIVLFCLAVLAVGLSNAQQESNSDSDSHEGSPRPSPSGIPVDPSGSPPPVTGGPGLFFTPPPGFMNFLNRFRLFN